ncbi:hypothetical protein KL930_004310 [Ogataea haglerorum]|uniref:Septin-type G domain-containing protein n=1 Tax=Ogataea haglerorum TaxID=1937702 RepID=A0AAN6D2T8_9ASCO|nr:uncharacterized protein KL911_004203 [Ogataea haglerorum]KAG7692961.1 hypothetical protein KL915_004417 [Ogataea haglerorum]KAG7704472.1 hypothetical protein KL950_004279 [Ogataea haglerorum]KAG7715906.1 hypothetical protein KL913_003719 [Ogataea haglerorum]KAG7716529.1 hypothetical protein KL949_003820 [Ogataea haglerorum]KAG7725546.1 hypothetical protein KL933_004112 [Ogataea haglerorum]
MVTVLGNSAALRKRKTLKKSLNFTVMVVGESGSGRSTFINSLCDQLIVEPSSTIHMYSPEELISPDREMQLRKSTVELEDGEGVRICLNLIDTPGFGTSLDNSVSFQVITDYVKHQYDEILIEESKLRRNPRFKDCRVHVCLYFITPTGHGLKEQDVVFMQSLGELVNIVPVIAKADSLTLSELKLNKKLIMEDIEHYKLPIFDFNDDFFNLDEGADEETIELNKYLGKTLPFAVMGSNTTHKDPASGEVKRVRVYPWGTIDIFDNEISDFLSLKNTLLITHLNDFKDYTHEVLYENYRAKTLGEEGEIGDVSELSRARVSSMATSMTGVANGNGAHQSPKVADSPALDDKEEQIRLEEERLRAFEERVQRDLMLKKEEIEARERELAEIERRLAAERLEA